MDSLPAATNGIRLHMLLRRKGQDADRAAQPWHAVRVVAGNLACAAVAKLGNTRFLSREAPLPLVASLDRPGGNFTGLTNIRRS